MEKINIGGQAVLEGVMMRAPRAMAIAVRRPSGEIVIKREAMPPLSERYPIVKLPILRGAVALFTSLVLGIKALNFSANEAIVEEENGEEKKEELSSWALAGTMATAFGFGIGLFFFLPLYLTKLLVPVIGDNNIVFNLVDGVIRVVVFLLYIWSISRMKDIRRVFQYHGAEHKTIFAFENGADLTLESVKRFSRLHPRCGTSFLLIVMLVSIAVFSLIPKAWPFVAKALSRIVLLPLIAGISYEFLKWSARNDRHPLVRMVIAPGLALQRMTTREPDDDQIEVAIRSVKEALDENNGYSDDRIVV
ncbi:DUF1385 domain-containing protein [Trichlorobacter ammonificans]|uniref:DUF1385 domain-containing protein n=1 Tax=Trichlorobacter ammonificans TaxID=2916410 RepID=A0ABN8HGC7_9BACT|nr:DUF1385 domain-containing protein [Trichlorobacter ammonificans]CAH2031851.1 conserved membrane protein of unknown function [Trichlorobacter ammonificans]